MSDAAADQPDRTDDGLNRTVVPQHPGLKQFKALSGHLRIAEIDAAQRDRQGEGIFDVVEADDPEIIRADARGGLQCLQDAPGLDV